MILSMHDEESCERAIRNLDAFPGVRKQTFFSHLRRVYYFAMSMSVHLLMGGRDDSLIIVSILHWHPDLCQSLLAARMDY